MSEFSSETDISSIQARLITLKSPTARTFLKDFTNIAITSEYKN